MDHLVGTPQLKPYMHGYFVSLKLYDAARLIANPFAYAEHREKVIKEKLEKKSESRIRARREETAVKVNKDLAEKVKREEERRKRKKTNDGEEAGETDEQGPGESVLTDPRFAKVWTDKEFEVDMGSREFLLKNPVAAPVVRRFLSAPPAALADPDSTSPYPYRSRRRWSRRRRTGQTDDHPIRTTVQTRRARARTRTTRAVRTLCSPGPRFSNRV